MTMRIDWHSHHTPPEVLQPLEAFDGQPRSGDELAAIDFSRRVQALDAAGVDVQLISPGAQFDPNCLPTEEAMHLVRRVNDLIAEGVSAYPDRLIGLVAICPRDVQGSVAEIERLAARGFRGVLMHPHCDGEVLLDQPDLAPVFATIAQLGMPIFLHGSGAPPDSSLAHLEGAGAGLSGVRGDAAVTEAVVRLVASGVFDRHPDLQVVVRSAGGGLPLLLNKLSYKHEGPEGQQRYADIVLEHVLVDTASANGRTVRFLADTLGEDRVVFGSDFGGGGRFERAVGAIEEQPDPSAFWARAERTSRRLLHI